MNFKIDMNVIKHNIYKKRYLILDLDETLVFTSKNKINKDSIKMDGFYLNLRPFLDQFLRETFQLFNLILFTAGE